MHTLEQAMAHDIYMHKWEAEIINGGSGRGQLRNAYAYVQLQRVESSLYFIVVL